MSEMEAEASTAPQQAASNVYIFDSIRSLQAQHGLKHGDYSRYRFAVPSAPRISLLHVRE